MLFVFFLQVVPVEEVALEEVDGELVAAEVVVADVAEIRFQHNHFHSFFLYYFFHLEYVKSKNTEEMKFAPFSFKQPPLI